MAFSTATSLGGMIRERAIGPQGEDVRLLHTNTSALPWLGSPQGDDESIVLSYAAVYDLACRAATTLRRAGVRPGDRVLLFLSTGPAFLGAFYGCQISGAVAVPVALPRTVSQIQRHLSRVARICEPAVTVVEGRLMPLFRSARRTDASARDALRHVVEDVELFANPTTVSEPHPVQPSDPAILQFTSGSTARPKGVTLSHANIFANVEHAASTVAGVRLGCCAAFGVMGRTTRGVEDLVLLCETTLDKPAARSVLVRTIRTKVLEMLGTAPDVVVLVERGTVLKTSSGKIRRQDMRERYLRQDLSPERTPWSIQARLLASSMLERLRRSTFTPRASS